jgi:hypothetical protein
MDPLNTVAGAAITEGVKFLYQQAGEFLSAWRARRKNRDARPPQAFTAPAGVVVPVSRPLADPPSEESMQLLQQLRDLVDPIQRGEVDTASPAARAAIELLRDMVEAALRAPVRLAGEPPRPLKVLDICVVAERVTGRVAGVRADLAKLFEGSEIRGVRVDAATFRVMSPGSIWSEPYGTLAAGLEIRR